MGGCLLAKGKTLNENNTSPSPVTELATKDLPSSSESAGAQAPTPSQIKSVREFFASYTASQPAQAKAVQAVIKWAKEASQFEPSGLVLWSTGYGVGKTHLARCAHSALAWSYRDGVMMSAPDFLDTIKSTYSDDRRTEFNLFRQWSQGYVILDDVGKDYSAQPEWSNEKYFRLFDGVVTNGANLLVTSNLTVKELAKRIGGAAFSRLAGLCGENGFVDMSGLPDWRLKNARPRLPRDTAEETEQHRDYLE